MDWREKMHWLLPPVSIHRGDFSARSVISGETESGYILALSLSYARPMKLFPACLDKGQNWVTLAFCPFLSWWENWLVYTKFIFGQDWIWADRLGWALTLMEISVKINFSSTASHTVSDFMFANFSTNPLSFCMENISSNSPAIWLWLSPLCALYNLNTVSACRIDGNVPPR